MADKTVNYKCPGCGGPLKFDADTEKVVCEYCGNIYELAEVEKLYADKLETATTESKKNQNESEVAWDVSKAGKDWNSEANQMQAYLCSSCGAELIADENTVATNCPYCGNPTIIPGKFGGILKPDYVIPFKLEKKDAIAALKKHYKGKVLLPKAFSVRNHIEEIKGIYVPFWLFDGEIEGDFKYHAYNSYDYREGDYIVTERSHYAVHRSGKINFEKVPVDGSSKMPDDYMDSIEPYDYHDLKEFSTAYLPGYLADKYDVDAEKASERAKDRCEETTYNEFKSTVRGYEGVDLRESKLKLNDGNVKYALLPVWLLNTKWKGNNYLFAMNGQTGKMIGDLPIDKAKEKKIFWITSICVSALLSLLFSGTIGHWIASIFS